MTSAAGPTPVRPALNMALVLALAGSAFVLKSVTNASLFRAALVVMWLLLLVAPLGTAMMRLVLPRSAAMHARVALSLALGYALAPLILLLTSRFGVIGLLAPTWIGLGALVLVGRQRRTGESITVAAPAAGGRDESVRVLLVIGALSVACVAPLMTPLREATSTAFVNLAYGDSFFHLNIVQGLMRQVPLVDWPNVAGWPPIFYQDFHHLLLATLARLAHVSATDMFFVYSPIAIVLLTVVVAYAVGAALTRSRVGGYVAAALQYIVLVPNIYDRNVFLQDQWSYVLPNFYQIHFYNLRYAQHAASGWIMVLAIVLCWSLALRAKDTGTALRVTAASALCLAVLFRFRPQYFLIMVVPSAVLALWLSRKRPAILFAAGAVGAIALAWTLYPYSTLQTNSSGLVLKYGVFAARVSRVGYFLPNAVSRLIAHLPGAVSPAVGLAAVLGMRIVGLNLLVLGGVGLWCLRRARRASWLQQPEMYLWLAVLTTYLMALLVEQSAVDANIGWNILQGAVAPALLLAACAVVVLVGAGRLDRLWQSHRSVWLAVAVLCSLVAYRGAEAVMHERTDRAYPLTSKELAAYEWVHRNTAANAVVVADPRHRVNALGEMIQNSTFLSGMTERSVYVQYLSPFTRPEAERRVELVTSIYSAESTATACELMKTTTADYWLEYADRPFMATALPCLERVFTGEPSIYRSVRR